MQKNLKVLRIARVDLTSIDLATKLLNYLVLSSVFARDN